MEFTLTERDGCVVIAFGGDILGGPEASALNKELHHLIDQEKKEIVIDLGMVSLMNSSGLGILISCHATVNNAHGALAIACANPTIRGLIDMTRLNTIFQLDATVDDAVARIAGARAR